MEEAPIPAETAVGNGYAESKWVAEQILLEAASKTQLESTIVRVGQISGGKDGDWNINEWFPSLVQSAAKLGHFPDVTGTVDWIPLDLAARVLVEFSKFPATPSILHLVHPRPVAWSSIAASLSAELSLDVVPYSQWLSALEQENKEGDAGQGSVQRVRELRALRLLSFFQSIARKEGGKSAMGFPALAVTNAKACSPSLADPALTSLGATDVHKWVAYWRKVGLLA